MNKLQPNHRLNDNLTKLQSSDNKMILLNLIRQEHNKSIHHKIEKNKFKSVLKDLLEHAPHHRNEVYESQELLKSQELQEFHESQELYESSSKFEMKNEIEQIENHLDFSNIYEKNESEEMIYYDPDQANLKTVANIMYQKNKLDQLIKKKKW